MFALVMGLAITSCKSTPAEPTAEGGDQQETVQQDQDPVQAMTALVEKAKAEGANWSVDEWKDAYTKVLVALKPMFNDLSALYNNVDFGNMTDEQATELMTKATELQTKYGDLEKLMSDFDDAAKATENGKAVSDDEEWAKAKAAELGITLPDM